MYLNLQLGNFHVVLGKLAEQVKSWKVKDNTVAPFVFTPFSAEWLNDRRHKTAEEFFLDDETKLRYQITK